MVYNVRMKSIFFSVIVSILLITVSCVGVFNASSISISSIIKTNYVKEKKDDVNQINYKPTDGFFLRLMLWILTILGFNTPDDDPDDGGNNGDDGGGDTEATSPQVYTKSYDIFTNSYGDQMLRLHGILEKTGTAGTGIATPDFSWTWFEYKINGVIYETEPLMCRGDGLPRTFMYAIPIVESPGSPEIPPGIHYFRACSRNAARLSDCGEWATFRV